MSEVAFKGLLGFISGHWHKPSQGFAAGKLALQQAQISSYTKKAPTSTRWWKGIFHKVYELGYGQGQKDATERFMGGLVSAFGQIPQQELADALRVTQPAVSNWLRGVAVPSANNFQRLLALHVCRLAEPLVEFYPLAPLRTGDSWKHHGETKAYNKLREKLFGRKGIYVFYDSAGRVTYVGKTVSNLWQETKERLKATVNRPLYEPSRRSHVQQGEIVRFVSAYEVRVPEAIHNLEVLMLRAFPNDLANTNIGKFKNDL